MKKRPGFLFFAILTLCCISKISFGWGHQGHQMIAKIAFNYLDSATQQKIRNDLQNFTIANAATWMDDVREQTEYNYMRNWHFVAIDKGASYQQRSDDAIYQLNRVMTALQNRASLPADTITLDLCILFHLVGDIHQPLHVGYAGDWGGNKVRVSFPGNPNDNLHHVWDDEIIFNKEIGIADCLQINSSYSASDIDSIQKLDPIGWMMQSRALLESNVYQFQDNTITQAYIDSNAAIVEKQLGLAGLRLAGILKELYK